MSRLGSVSCCFGENSDTVRLTARFLPSRFLCAVLRDLKRVLDIHFRELSAVGNLIAPPQQ